MYSGCGNGVLVNTQDDAHGGLVVNDESRTPEAVIKTDYPLVI